MGLIENGAAQPESNMVEQPRTPKDPARDKKYDPPYDCRMDHKRCVGETMEQKEMSEAQYIERTSVSAQEESHDIREIGLNTNNRETPHNEDTNKQEPTLENVSIFSDSKYLEFASQNGLGCLEDMVIPPGTTSVNPGCGTLVPLNVEATNDSVLLENGDRGSSGESPGCGKLIPLKVEATNDSVLLENDGIGSSRQRVRRNAKLEGPSSSSWLLRSRSQEKTKAPEPVENVNEGSAIGEKKKRGRKPKNMQKTTVSEFSSKKTHLRYLMHRINYEQNLIDAYSAEGWRGQSLDKLKPEKELEKAKSRILHYKLKIRALFQSLDQSLAMGKLPESLFDAQGEIDSEDIFCAKCGSKDLTLDNDIILCDGACERGFHQFCLEPPLLKTDIPPGDESWLCPGCDCKADCIDMLKDFQETKISIVDSWEKIFPEAAAAASGKKMDDGSGSSSDDSEDEEYDPDKPDSSEKVEGNKSSSDESSYISASDDLDASNNNEKYLGLPSDDSEDDDFNPSATNRDNQVKQGSSSSDFTSDSEDLRALIEDETATSEDPWQTSSSAHHKQKSEGFGEEISNLGRKKRQSLKDELSYLMEASAEPLSRKRHVERLDYKKLNDETYGNSSSDSSDEDFDDTITRKRTKSDRDEVKFSDETLVTPSNTHKEDENQIEKKHFPKRTRRNRSDGHTTESSAKVGSASASAKKSTHKRLGEATTQRLLAYFNLDQYPDRVVKENLAKELGLAVRQVGKWFENARWSYNHRPRVESDSSHQNAESSAISAQNHIAKLRGGDLVTDTSGDSPGTPATKKRKGNLDQAPGEEER
ncbi:pathogenesis-related homeodomain protein [Salvia miltiorrhiza]|uniref:pathogenesis-related homeodomain protein n=1 Tax=Salvia miltiorrhiza TaxID=226208 RepID=UPI0025ACCEC6|nr:pathogenesis-related homeodomain protein [Salvia miltiorrhiza]XP_057788188.1 pathogenesis-related homeodomain protein [Salvia miltiorrhiza]